LENLNPLAQETKARENLRALKAFN